MCGLSAIFAPTPQVRLVDLLRMTRAVIHRGPDDGGLLFIGGSAPDTPRIIRDKLGTQSETDILTAADNDGFVQVGLGHRRLSIIELSEAGSQPMVSPDSRFWVSYNGEIYNYVELREELIHLGYSFSSTSDTEVLLAAYSAWGPSCLERFNGMFAFVLYDHHLGVAFVARDRFGVKPLYYWRAPNGSLHFASEIKQFVTLSGWQPKLNRARAYDFLAWGLSDHTRETSFNGVFQILPGHCATFRVAADEDYPNEGGSWRAEHAWYQLHARTVPDSLEEAAEELRKRLLASITLRLRSDVRVGANLSGGMDSSTIVCLLDQLYKSKANGPKLYCISAGSDYPQFDERHYIDQVLSCVQATSKLVNPRFEDLEHDIGQVVRQHDEPFASTSIYAEWCIYRQAANSGIKVMLGGQGADEQLAGYPEHISHYYRSWLRAGTLAPLLRDIQAAHQVYGTPCSSIMARLVDTFMPQPLRQAVRNYRGSPSSQPSWLDPTRLGVTPYDPYESSGYRGASVRDASRIQLERTNLPMQLRWEDRNSMAHSIESRAPYLDYELVEYLHGLPDNFRYFHGESKVLLRRAMRGIVPAPILERRDKMGFVMPEAVWAQQLGQHFFKEAVSRAIERSGGIIKSDAFNHFVEMIEGKRRFSHSLWRVISFGMWLQNFDVSV
jgi:asparagine synthase (glutamine-hydrolysing)